MTIVDYLIVTAVGVNVGSAITNVLMGRRQRRRYEHRQAARDRDNTDLRTVVAGLPDRAGDISGTINTGAASGDTDSGLAESTADIPILAYKNGSLQWSPGGTFAITGGHRGSIVKTDIDAECWSGSTRPHAGPVPDPGCSCGFYGFRSPEVTEGFGYYGFIRLDVEFSGRVIVAECGYRAQHQRVLRVHVPPCYWCGERATVVALIERVAGSGYSGYIEPRALCAEHVFGEGVKVPIEKVMRSIGLPWEDDVPPQA